MDLSSFYDLEKLTPTKATVTMRFNLSEPQKENQVIKIGTRVSSNSNVFFETLNDIYVQPGAEYVDGVFECTVEGSIGNNFTPGQINMLVDPLSWIASVANIDKSEGGSDIEDEESYRNRIHEAPEGFSTAGPEGAYKFFAKKYSSLIKDIAGSSPSAGVVNI
ncbi:baseplate J/gp47 family protein [Clostridium sp. JS66]|nr:baseplate J/gp47 family protein [Clostridium sp. JS66]